MTQTLHIYCKNTKEYIEVPIGATLLEIYRTAGEPLNNRPLNAWVNNRVEAMNYQCWHPKDVEFVDISYPSGRRTYISSLCFVLSKAINNLFPRAKLCIEHPISNGYYCVVAKNKQISAEDIEHIKQRMQAIISADLPFEEKTVRLEEATELFEKQGMNDKVKLIESAGMPYTSYYVLDGYYDYFYGCLAPSTGYLSVFDLVPYQGGILLRIPKATNPEQIAPMLNQNKLFDAYKQHLRLQNMINLNNVGDLNRSIEGGFTKEIVQVSEAMQEKHIAQIAEEIAKRHKDGVRIVLIAGPSSSGKTTFCKRLQIQLITNLINPVGLSLDDYFLNRVDTPLDEQGEYDFESLYSLDLDLFNSDLKKLIEGKEIDLPTYDFETGKRVFKGKKLRLQQNTVLVMEGIHALNPELTAMIDEAMKYRVYVSALTTISLDNHNWIPTTDNRLLRRIIRDFRSRGYSARDTIARWPSVRKGEDKWIFPYQENADAMFNSAMLYELAALRPYAESILLSVKECEEEYVEAHRLLCFLRYFTPISDKHLPRMSLLREFVGGSDFV